MLSPLGIAAEAAGRGIEFAREVSGLIWGGSVEGWDQADHLEQASRRAGLELSALQQWVSDNADKWPDQLQKNDAALEQHHWGVPTMLFQGEPFFGQDRIDSLCFQLEKDGLSRSG